MENADTIIGTQLTTVQLHFTATYSEVVWVVQKKKEQESWLEEGTLGTISLDKKQPGIFNEVFILQPKSYH